MIGVIEREIEKMVNRGDKGGNFSDNTYMAVMIQSCWNDPQSKKR